jgi:hypothetical protein
VITSYEVATPRLKMWIIADAPDNSLNYCHETGVQFDK